MDCNLGQTHPLAPRLSRTYCSMLLTLPRRSPDAPAALLLPHQSPGQSTTPSLPFQSPDPPLDRPHPLDCPYPLDGPRDPLWTRH